jgi:hypothetical protein
MNTEKKRKEQLAGRRWKHSSPERKERWYTVRLFGMNSLKEGAMWHVNALPGNGSINTLRYTHQQWNNGVMQPASKQRFGKHTSMHMQWCHIPTVLCYHVTFVLCGLRYMATELPFLRCPCGAYITKTCCSLDLWAQKSFLVEFRGSRVIEQEMVRRFHSDLKC